MREYTYVVERDEEGWLVASVPALPGCHTQAHSMEELEIRIKEAIELYLETVPDMIETEFVAIYKVAV